MRHSMVASGTRCLISLWLLLCLCQKASSNGELTLRLDKYRNPNNVLNEGEQCDTFGGVSPCDLRFVVSYEIGSEEKKPYCSTSEYSNTIEVSNFCPSPISVSFSGAFPISADNWKVWLDVWDVDATPDQKVDDIRMNELFDPPASSIRSKSFNGVVPSDFTTVTTKLKFEKTLTWSYKIYCAQYYYSGLCDKYCKPADNSIEGHYSCSASGDKECLAGYWDPATNCKNTYCSGTPLCQNNATCNHLTDGYTCRCTKEYTGRHCELPKNPCAKYKPCRNGNCRNPSDGVYICDCYPGYAGTNCSADIDECAGGPSGCNLAGTANCTNSIGSFECDCKAGWSGSYCRNLSDYCLANNPCLHGNCSNGNASAGANYTCACRDGWTGDRCDRDVDECAAPSKGGLGDCLPNGTAACVNSNGSFACHCRPGWTGPLCSEISDYCLAMKPACHHGNCSNVGSSNYTCACNSGWEGAACETDIDECSRSGYCVKRLACENTNGSYTSPLRHQTEPRPCVNGNCTSKAGSFGPTSDYLCSCSTGWEGRNCTADRNECQAGSDPCAFGQACVNLPGGYRCDATVAGYWWVFLIIVLILLLAAAVIIGWRVLVCRQRTAKQQFEQGQTKPAVRQQLNVKWPTDDRRTLDGWGPEKEYDYGSDERSPRLPPRNPNLPRMPAIAERQAAPVPASGLDAEYELVRTTTAAAPETQLEDTGTYADLRQSKMLDTDEPTIQLNETETGPKPPVPDAPRPTEQRPATAQPLGRSSGSSNKVEESVYDNSGYLSSQPPSRPVSNPGYLEMNMTNSPDGYVRPISVAIDQPTEPNKPQLPPKPQKVKRRKLKKPPPPPPQPQDQAATTTTTKEASSAVAAAVDVPEIHLIDTDGVDSGPLPVTMGRLNSGDASDSL
uniref:Delta-like protein n=1 Tax=Macrostomum lignano TaxID=282301 RepID=A0A1I8JID5_9PLAT